MFVVVALVAGCSSDDAVTDSSASSAPAPPATAGTETTSVPSSTSAPTFDASTMTEETIRSVATRPATLVERECDVDVRYDADCFWLEVPERRDADGSNTIQLWAAVINPDSTSGLPPIVLVTGGPGDTASTGLVDGTFELGVWSDRTVVVLDQRGTGRSTPRLTCPEFDGAIPASAPYADRAADQQELTARCRDRFIAEGIDLNGYDTPEIAADFVDLQQALGLEPAIVSGVSYGGRLAREIYRQRPEAVAGVILDSPLTTAPQGPASLAARGDDALARLTDACNTQPDCAATGNVADNIETAAQRLELEPYVPTGTDLVIDGDTLYTGAFTAMYRSDLIPALPGAAASLANGDNSILDVLAPELQPVYDDERDAPAEGMAGIVSCADDAAAYTNADNATLASPGQWGDLILAFAFDCDTWNVEPVDTGQLLAPTGDVPVLVTSGGLDPITPPPFTDEVTAQFPNTIIVRVPAGGHGDAFANDCVVAITNAFSQNPTAPLDTTCATRLPAPFAPQT
jgi:pimeloyl-ACP methyl ester carboxylesterase